MDGKGVIYGIEFPQVIGESRSPPPKTYRSYTKAHYSGNVQLQYSRKTLLYWKYYRCNKFDDHNIDSNEELTSNIFARIKNIFVVEAILLCGSFY